jgi:hypothetical protein
MVVAAKQREQQMTLFELFFFCGLVLIAVVAGRYGFSLGGFWIGISCGLLSVVLCVSTILLADNLTQKYRRFRRLGLRCPCGACADSDYEWIGNDSKHNPIAMYKCGKLVRVRNGTTEEIPENETDITVRMKRKDPKTTRGNL